MRHETIVIDLGVEVVVMDSISSVGPEESGRIVVSGSHGGRSAGEIAARYQLRGAFFNDAGVGKERAGVFGLTTLDQQGIPAATVSHQSARIGDALDTLDSGVLSEVNEAARNCGLRVGVPLRQALSDWVGRS
jgi:hypothetical protein